MTDSSSCTRRVLFSLAARKYVSQLKGQSIGDINMLFVLNGENIYYYSTMFECLLNEGVQKES